MNVTFYLRRGDEDLVARARELGGPRGFSAVIAAALRQYLEAHSSSAARAAELRRRAAELRLEAEVSRSYAERAAQTAAETGSDTAARAAQAHIASAQDREREAAKLEAKADLIQESEEL